MIYLDNAATTKPDKEVVRAMKPFLETEWGNPGGTYPFARFAFDAVERARRQCADLIGARPDQIVFTSGGTEANNLAILGSADTISKRGRPCVLTDRTEHPSVLRPAESLRIKRGFDVGFFGVNEDGSVNWQSLSELVAGRAGLVSVMYINNETGARNDVESIASLCREHGALFHTDCVQAAGFADLNVDRIGCDLLSFSSHKIHGVKGVGALYVRDRKLLSPVIMGSPTQEGGLRGGTLNVPGVVAFGQACEIAGRNRKENAIRVSTLRQVFFTELSGGLTDCGLAERLHVNGPSVVTPGRILSVRFDGVDSETLRTVMSAQGVTVSAGAACHALEQNPSQGLLALGLSSEESMETVRVSFTHENTGEEAVEAARVMVKAIRLLCDGDRV